MTEYRNERGRLIRGPISTPEHRAEFNEAGRQWAKRRALELILIHVPAYLNAETWKEMLPARRGLYSAFDLARQHGFEAEVAEAIEILLKAALKHSKNERAAVIAQLKKEAADADSKK